MKPNNLNLPSNKKFGFTFTIILLIIATYNLFHNNLIIGFFILLIVVFLFAVTLFIPTKLSIFNKGWMLIGYYLGKIINPLVLGLIYFIIFTPVSLLLKIIGYDELDLIDKDKKTNWSLQKNKLKKFDFYKQF